ncbi:GtrA family protein [Natrinema salaciae]|uniref:Putative flippase GtrA (Transmembrane translocase of bactoprenol-linked glucose) n=1 Tax=Natrinema salaciae TaxID=1186196 RepID=A0A1H9RDH9_9EURY|nr:GtrA family protein [Natrinema salaciae]SER70748.1 Putative flippase GtrA (transmembrane translocase of bactoprenol-linked glucose) [Natrinema salaciae]
MIRSFLRSLVDGPFAPQLRRFVAVGIVAAGVQIVLLWAFVDNAGLHYLLGALLAIECTIVLSYVLNNAWTFRAHRNTGTGEYLVGLLKTNVVRGTAIPIQIAVLFAFVEVVNVSYLVANGFAIAISGVYRYVLDARWTWGT